MDNLMDNLLHNFIADMYGPVFLLFYIGYSLLIIVICKTVIKLTDPTAVLTPPPVPLQPDPYEIAYLRGGELEVARLAVFNLVQREFLTVSQINNSYQIKQSPQAPDKQYMSKLENAVYGYFAKPQTQQEAFKKLTQSSQIFSDCTKYREKLSREDLVCTEEMKERADTIMWSGLAAVAGMASYKMVVAISKGHFNILFLILFTIIASIITYKSCRAERISRRGKAYLEQMQLAYDKFRERVARPTVVPEDPALLLTMVGLFGVGVLANSYYSSYNQMFIASSMGNSYSSSNWGSSGSCSSSSSSCSSSSCSSGSSCGGGGCGGGGCGGCGS